jgi:hypothetical protein
VSFIDDDDGVLAEQRVLGGFSEQDAVSHVLENSARAAALVEPYDIADLQ